MAKIRTKRRKTSTPELAATPLDRPATSLAASEGWLSEWASAGRPRGLGPAMNERTALCVPAVYACVRLRAGLIAQMPLKVYKREPDGSRREAPEHRMWDVLSVAPNQSCPITSYQWLESLSQAIDLYGNGFGKVIWDLAGRAIGVEPWNPWQVSVWRDVATGRNLYQHSDDNGQTTYYDQDEVLHVFGPSNDGIVGASKIRYHMRDAISLAATLSEQTARVHENAAVPSGALKLPSNITKDGLKMLRGQFERVYSGRENAGRVMFLDAGTEFSQFQIRPVDLATIEQREMQVAEICGFFGVPLHLVGGGKSVSTWGSGIAEMNLGLLQYSIAPDCKRIESELNRKVFWGTGYFCEFDRSVLLQMNPQAMAETSRTEIASGIRTPNEARKQRNLPPVNGGDALLVNSATVRLDSLTAQPSAPAVPAPANAGNLPNGE